MQGSTLGQFVPIHTTVVNIDTTVVNIDTTVVNIDTTAVNMQMSSRNRAVAHTWGHFARSSKHKTLQ